jgi:4-hydroxybenzoate polyprenyltransferase
MSDIAAKAYVDVVRGRPFATATWEPIRFLAALARALRPKQWAKNGLLFVALAFTASAHEPTSLAKAMAAFLIFCAISSAGYLVNDVADVEADRQHPDKRRRPIAAGLVPIPLALALAVTLAVGGLAAAYLITPTLCVWAVVYLAVTAAYTVWFKHMVLLDLFGIAAGFVVRAVAGAAAIDVPASSWLLAATMLGALLIALGKRRAELSLLGANAESHRSNLGDYTIGLVDQLILIVSSAVVMTYALYTFSAPNLPADHSMMLTVPVVLYGLFRYLLLTREGTRAGAPEDLFLGDRPLLAAVAVWGVLSLAILYASRLGGTS